jgi:hypothetical protein
VIESHQVSSVAVRLMHAYTDGPFDAVTMSRAAAPVGTRSPMSDQCSTFFDLPGGAVLHLAAEDAAGAEVGAAVVTLCGWDPAGGELVLHPERTAYDECYDQALAAVRAEIGPPDHTGADPGPYPFPFRWSVWLGTAGLLALQQSDYDYCPDINLWARPHPAEGFTPTEPFSDWLMTTPRAEG